MICEACCTGDQVRALLDKTNNPIIRDVLTDLAQSLKSKCEAKTRQRTYCERDPNR